MSASALDATDKATFPVDRSTQYMRCKVVFEVDGELFPEKPTGTEKKRKSLSLLAVSNLEYDERCLSADANARSVRIYRDATANIKVADLAETNTLRDDRRLIIAQADGHAAVLFSPNGALTREELALIEVPGNSLILHRLLPPNPLSVEEKYQVHDDVLAALLNLDAVTGNDIVTRLSSLDATQARFEMSGSLVGAIHGVSTDIRLNGKFTYDRRVRQITWIALGIGESREAGVAEPGLQVTARLRMIRGPQDSVPELVDAAVAEMELSSTEAMQLVELRPGSGHIRLLHDRRWHLMTANPSLTVLRMVETGNMIAQCNIRVLPDQTDDTPITPTTFHQEIQKGLGSSFQQLVDSTDDTTPEGLRVLRATVVGMVSDAPVQWIYYHVTAPDKRRLSCVFTMSSDAVEKFAGADVAMTSSLQFMEGASQSATTNAHLDRQTIR